MIIIGVICILIGLLMIWMGDGRYQEAKTDLPFYKSKKCVKQGDLCFMIGTIALLTGAFYIIGYFMI